MATACSVDRHGQGEASNTLIAKGDTGEPTEGSSGSGTPDGGGGSGTPDPKPLQCAAEVVGSACDGDDADLCLDGELTCIDGVPICNDDEASRSEVCDGVDNDCDGVVDNGAGCPCTIEHWAGHAYLACDEEDAYAERFEAAQGFCAQRGYQLLTINSLDENDWIAQTFPNERGWWLNLRYESGDHLWEDGSVTNYAFPWEEGQPTHRRARRCVRSEDGLWASRDCERKRTPFICESH